MSNLNHNASEKDIAKFISFQGKVTLSDSDIMLRHHSSNPEYPGYAYVDCGSTENASSLVEELNMTTSKKLRSKRKIWVTWVEWKEPEHIPVQKSRGNYTTFKVYIKKIHHSVTEEALRKMCSKFGSLAANKGVKVAQMNGYPLNEAVAKMQSLEDANALCEGLNGHKVEGLAMVTIGEPPKSVKREFGLEWPGFNAMATKDHAFFRTNGEHKKLLESQRKEERMHRMCKKMMGRVPKKINKKMMTKMVMKMMEKEKGTRKRIRKLPWEQRRKIVGKCKGIKAE